MDQVELRELELRIVECLHDIKITCLIMFYPQLRFQVDHELTESYKVNNTIDLQICTVGYK